jgi:molybdenum cofactor guanylyltransferase
VTYPSTFAVVLAGGLARRISGGDKGALRIGNTSILERVVARLTPQCARVILNVNDDPARFASTGLAVAADSIPGRPGPLAGVLAGLDWVARHAPAVDWLVSAPSDCPFLPRDLVDRLHHARLAAGTLLACAQSAQRRHHVVAIWAVELRETLRHSIVTGGIRKVEHWSEQQGVAVADWPVVPVDPFFNVNTPADLVEARRLAGLYPEI